MGADKDQVIRIMERSPLFEGIHRNILHLIYDEVRPVMEAYDKNEVIVHEGEEEREIGIVTSGYLRGEGSHEGGDIHLVDIFEPGDIFSLSAVTSQTREAPVTISASVSSEILTLDGNQLRSCRGGNIVRENIIRVLADENIQRLQKLDILSYSGLRDRILAYLQIMARKHQSNSFHIMMTQEQFSQYLSVNRSALSNELNKMRREGVIDFKKDRFTLLTT